jgi:transcriptional regulator with XRE-family HTH domain
MLDPLDNISQEIRRLRKQKGWSQQQLAELAGLDRTTLGSIERNDYNDIGIRKVQRLLTLLGKTLTLAAAGLPTLDQLQAEKERN